MFVEKGAFDIHAGPQDVQDDDGIYPDAVYDEKIAMYASPDLLVPVRRNQRISLGKIPKIPAFCKNFGHKALRPLRVSASNKITNKINV